MAPTYTIIKINPKNSKPRVNKIKLKLIITAIKANTAWTGFEKLIIKQALITVINNNTSISITNYWFKQIYKKLKKLVGERTKTSIGI